VSIRVLRAPPTPLRPSTSTRLRRSSRRRRARAPADAAGRHRTPRARRSPLRACRRVPTGDRHEVHGSGTWNHHGAERIRDAAAPAWHHEHRAVNESLTQVGDPCLPLLLALFFSRMQLGASVSHGSRRGVRDRLHPERAHHHCRRIVAATHRSRPAGECGIEQQAIPGPDVYANVRTKLSVPPPAAAGL
jgi:hypothetical protein